jgi:hypothetical protein
MFRRVTIAAAVVALLTPTAAFAAPKKTHKSMAYKAGQHCTTKKESTYKAHGFTCVNGHLHAVKKK